MAAAKDGEAPKAIHEIQLDEHRVYSVPVSIGRVTTVSFPGPIAAIDAALVATDDKTQGLFQLAHQPGTAFFSVRSLDKDATTNVNVRFNNRTYVLELKDSPAPVLSLIFQSPPDPRLAAAKRQAAVTPAALLSALDLAKAYPALKEGKADVLREIAYKDFRPKPPVMDHGEFQIRLEEAFRFDAQDTLVFRVILRNLTDRELRYDPGSFVLRVGENRFTAAIESAKLQGAHDKAAVLMIECFAANEATMRTAPDQNEQIQAATTALHSVLGEALLAVYLHGSAALGKLQPQSDIDLLAVVGRDLTENQRDDLLTALLRISGRHPSMPGGSRCIEVIVFRLSDLSEGGCPARAEFIYGEWLRQAFEAGERFMSAHDPEHTLVLAQARLEALPLFGPNACELLPEISPEHVRQAMRNTLPALMEGLRGDERNVLLTLARMWRTAGTGEFVTKDAAATWAIPQLTAQDAATLDHARSAYVGEIVDEWQSRGGDVRRLAARLRERVVELL